MRKPFMLMSTNQQYGAVALRTWTLQPDSMGSLQGSPPLPRYSRYSNNVTSFNIISIWWKIQFPARTPAWSLHVLPMSVWIFSRDSAFLPHHKDVHVRWQCLHCPSPSGCVWVPLPVWEGILARGGPTLYPDSQKWVRKQFSWVS